MHECIKRFTIDLQEVFANEYVQAKPGDSGRSIYVEIANGGVPYELTSDCTAVLRAKKPDGTILYHVCTIEDGIVKYRLREQTLAIPGIVRCEFAITGNDGRQVSSPTFLLMVDENTLTDEEIESKDEIDTFMTYTLVGEDGTVVTAVVVDDETIFDATAEDILEGKTAATASGVTVGTLDINPEQIEALLDEINGEAI